MQFEPMRSGETIRNDATGETLTMLESEQENGEVRQLYAVRVPPRRPSPPLHYHVAFTEAFTVMEGTLDFYLGRQRRQMTLRPGQSVTAAIGLCADPETRTPGKQGYRVVPLLRCSLGCFVELH